MKEDFAEIRGLVATEYSWSFSLQEFFVGVVDSVETLWNRLGMPEIPTNVDMLERRVGNWRNESMERLSDLRELMGGFDVPWSGGDIKWNDSAVSLFEAVQTEDAVLDGLSIDDRIRWMENAIERMTCAYREQIATFRWLNERFQKLGFLSGDERTGH